MTRSRAATIALLWLAAPTAAHAAAVFPQLGGGSPGGASNTMKHADVFFDFDAESGVYAISVEVDDSVDAPRLRPLLPGDTFLFPDAQAAFGDKAYNAQFGWQIGSGVNLPSGSAVWIEALSSTPGLEVYQAPPELPAFEPIFGTGGSSPKWKWSTTSMVHNYYASEDWIATTHEATYRVSVGHAETGADTPGFRAGEVTFVFAAPGDLNGDDSVDVGDYATWSGAYGAAGVSLDGDANGDGVVDAADYTVWRDGFPGVQARSVPEPAAWALAACTAPILRRRRCRAT